MARIAKQNIREKILEAAQKRLWHYGIKKTTIDEIAADAGVGKGTVYLYFESKEDICLSIFAGYKCSVLEEQEQIVAEPDVDIFSRIVKFLLVPIETANRRCAECPEALELIADLKPHLSQHLRPYFEQEIALLATMLKEAGERDEISVDAPAAAARSLKLITAGFMPPYPVINNPEEAKFEIEQITRLVLRGLLKHRPFPGTFAAANQLDVSAKQLV